MAHGHAGELRMDGPGLDVRVAASQRQAITLVLTEADRARLLGALQQGKPSAIDIHVQCRSGRDQPAALSMWVRSSEGHEGRLLRQFVPGESSFRVQLLAQHTLTFTAGAYLQQRDRGIKSHLRQILIVVVTRRPNRGWWNRGCRSGAHCHRRCCARCQSPPQ